MPGKAKSIAKKRKDVVVLTEEYMQMAVSEYRKGEQSLSKICQMFIRKCYDDTKKTIKLTTNTLLRRVNGGKSQAEVNADRSRLLTVEEEERMVDYAVAMAKRGFPCSHSRLREHANEILFARLGDEFDGVGINWVQRFVLRHDARLSPYWSHPLDHSRARAVNPANHQHYCNILECAINGEGPEFEGDDDEGPVLSENIYGTDETGIQKGIGVRERVYGPAGMSLQHQQRSGNRENITVMATICGDGTSYPPAVIFKGEGYQAAWKQNNPLDAS